MEDWLLVRNCFSHWLQLWWSQNFAHFSHARDTFPIITAHSYPLVYRPPSKTVFQTSVRSNISIISVIFKGLFPYQINGLRKGIFIGLWTQAFMHIWHWGLIAYLLVISTQIISMPNVPWLLCKVFYSQILHSIICIELRNIIRCTLLSIVIQFSYFSLRYIYIWH